MQEYKFYFGCKRPDGSLITDDQFSRFVDEHMLGYYSGLTVVNGDGRYMTNDGNVVTEPCKVVTVLTTADQHIAHDICDAYCRLFDQESVLLTHTDYLNFGFRGRHLENVCA